MRSLVSGTLSGWRTLEGGSYQVKSVAFSTGSRSVVSGSYDNTRCGSETQKTGAPLQSLKGYFWQGQLSRLLSGRQVCRYSAWVGWQMDKRRGRKITLASPRLPKKCGRSSHGSRCARAGMRKDTYVAIQIRAEGYIREGNVQCLSNDIVQQRQGCRRALCHTNVISHNEDRGQTLGCFGERLAAGQKWEGIQIQMIDLIGQGKCTICVFIFELHRRRVNTATIRPCWA